MKRIAAFLLAFGAMTYAIAQQPTLLPPETLRTNITATVDGTLLAITQPRQNVADLALRGFKGTTYNGRCLAVLAPFTRVWNCSFVAGDDDSLSLWGDAHGSVVIGCEFIVEDWKNAHGICCGADGVQPNFGAADGYAGQFIGCKIEGSHGAGRLRGGVWHFVDCDIHISSLYGLDCMDAKANFIGCRFITRPKPDGAPYWYRDIGPCPIRVTAIKNGLQSATNLKSAIFSSGCTLDGKPVTTADLLRRFNPTLGYDGPGSVPKSCFRVAPN